MAWCLKSLQNKTRYALIYRDIQCLVLRCFCVIRTLTMNSEWMTQQRMFPSILDMSLIDTFILGSLTRILLFCFAMFFATFYVESQKPRQQFLCRCNLRNSINQFGKFDQCLKWSEGSESIRQGDEKAKWDL